MKKKWRIVALFVFMLFTFQLLFSFKKKEPTNSEVVQEMLVDQLRQFSIFLQDTLTVEITVEGSEKQLQQAFLNARNYYKRVEWATEYFTYSTAKTINGAPKAELDMSSQTISAPSGLQVLETYLFPHYKKESQKEIQNEVALLTQNVAVLLSYFSNIEVKDWQILDALKLEIFRIETIGITGFDNGLTLNSMMESAISLASVSKIFQLYNKESSTNPLFATAIQYLNLHQEFVSFDRAYFIQHFANSISTLIEQTRRKLSNSALSYNRLLRQDVFTLFDSGAFNSMAYAPFVTQENINEKIQLGKVLFRDVALSKTQTRSCASCHIPEQAFANNISKESSINGVGTIDRNTPTLINTALQPQQFYDQRAGNVEDQVVDVIHNKKEMDGCIEDAWKSIKKDKKYIQLIKNAYPKKELLDKSVIVESLSSYVRSLVKLNSRFDEYMRGDSRKMNADELNGFNLFMGKAQCATCHYMPLFNGVFPPKFIAQDVEILGVPESIDYKKLDKDRGVYDVLQQQGLYDSLWMKEYDHGFKTVTIRNVSKTAPYMHNGIFSDLEQVMDFYNFGGGLGKGLNVKNQSLSSNKLNLTAKEIADVIAFMHTLDSQ